MIRTFGINKICLGHIGLLGGIPLEDTEPQYRVFTDENGLLWRKGIRDGYIVLDVALTVTGFSGTENIDWENVEKTAYLTIPTNLTVEWNGDFAELNWISDYAIYIERSTTDETNYTYLTTINAGIFTCTDETVNTEETYYYRIKAVIGTIEGPFTSGILLDSYWTPQRTPSTLSLTVISDTEIQLDWVNNGLGFTGHSIERSDDGINFSEIDTIAIGTNHYHDTGLTSGAWYYYRVRAYKGLSYSDYSNIADEVTNISALLADGNTFSEYNSDVPASMTLDVNGRVEDMQDLQANDKDLVAGFGGKYPLLDANEGLVFAGDHYKRTYYTTFNQPCCYYLIIKQTNWTDLDALVHGADGSNVMIYQATNAPFIRAYAGTPSGTYNMELNRWVLLKVVINGASSKLQINQRRLISGNYGAGTANGITVGGYPDGSGLSWMNFKRGIFRKTYSDADWLAIGNYLQKRYESILNVTPDTFAKTTICILGDSISVNLHNYMTNYSVTNLATGGLAVEGEMRTVWDIQTFSLQEAQKYVVIALGINNYGGTVALFVTDYQNAVNQVRAETASDTVIIGMTITPCKASTEWSGLYQNWLDMNEAVRGDGSTPITGLDHVIDSHTIALNDGEGNLLALYDNGDHLHLNAAGQELMANKILEVIDALES